MRYWGVCQCTIFSVGLLGGIRGQPIKRGGGRIRTNWSRSNQRRKNQRRRINGRTRNQRGGIRVGGGGGGIGRGRILQVIGGGGRIGGQGIRDHGIFVSDNKQVPM